MGVQGGSIQARTAATEPSEFLIGTNHEFLAATMASGNGTGNFDVTKGGTALGKVTATGLVRPCATTNVDGAQATVNTVTVDETGGFLTGDVGSIYSALGVQASVTIDGDAASTADIDMTDAGQMDGLAHRIILSDPGGVLGTVLLDGDGAAGANFSVTNKSENTLAHATVVVDPGGTLGVSATIDGDGAAGAPFTITSILSDGLAHAIIVVDPGANNQTLSSWTAIAAGVETTTVLLETGGAGAIASTVSEVIGAYNAASKVGIAASTGGAPGNTAVAIGSTAMAGAVAGGNPAIFGASNIAAGVETVSITLAHVAGAITSTVADVISEFNATSQTCIALAVGGAPANTAAAIGSTAIAGGVAGDTDLQASSIIAAATGIETLTITLEHSGGAIQSTVNEVIGEINSGSHLMEAALAAGGVGTNTAAAVASTPLAGGIAAAGAIASARTITVASATQLTLSGGAFSVAADDVVNIDNGADTAIGILRVSNDSYEGRDATGTAIHTEKGIQYIDEGSVDESQLALVNAAIKTDLSNVTFR